MKNETNSKTHKNIALELKIAYFKAFIKRNKIHVVRSFLNMYHQNHLALNKIFNKHSKKYSHFSVSNSTVPPSSSEYVSCYSNKIPQTSTQKPA